MSELKGKREKEEEKTKLLRWMIYKKKLVGEQETRRPETKGKVSVCVYY